MKKISRFDRLSDLLSERNPEALLADGFEDALVGIAQQFSRHLALYDYDLCVQVLKKRDGMTHTDALERMEYNVVGSYAGENTPLFLIAD